MLVFTTRDRTKYIIDENGVTVETEAAGLWTVKGRDGFCYVTADLRWMETKDAVAWLTDPGRMVAGAPVDRALLEGIRKDIFELGIPEADELVFRLEQIIRSE